jgi:steroid 5-alpha reductase family enzyme
MNDIYFLINDPLTRIFLTIMLSTTVVCFLTAELTLNYSQVDKLWSLMPVIYSLTALISHPTPRLCIMCILVIIWGFRLSFNFYRKGGYNIIPWRGEEDYRWKIIRRHPKLRGRIRFALFNLLFISFYQNFIIFLFSTPLLLAAKCGYSSMNLTDVLAATFMSLCILTEAVADNQLFRFRKLKQQSQDSEGPTSISINQGFLSEGLWRYVRHPNYASEQAIWISFYLFGAASCGKWINWTITGPLLLILLFLGSTEFTERINIDKYPGYARYKKEVPKFFPRLFNPVIIRKLLKNKP